MRIVLMPSAYAPAIGGVEELTRQLGSDLIERGNQVEVWTQRHPSDLPHVEEIGGVVVRRFTMPLPASSLGSLACFVAGAPRALRQLMGATRAFQPDVLHVQCFSGNGVYAAALSRLSGTPLVITLQGETLMDDRDIYEHSASLRLGLRAGLRQAAVVSACSAFVLEDAVMRFGLRSGRGVVVPNGVEVRRGRVPAKRVELPFDRYVLALGRVVEKKGFDLLLDAFAEMAGSHPGLGLVIGGQGSARAGLELRAAALGVKDLVAFPGSLGRGEVGWAMRNAELFVMPSRIEPFGIVTLEALAAGCPVIVSSRGGASEIVRDGVDGLVVDPFDRQALANSIETLLVDSALRERFSGYGRLRVQQFAWTRIVDRYTELYERAGAERDS
jgi:glycosyltransferase involved in cell wall biosynthesis